MNAILPKPPVSGHVKQQAVCARRVVVSHQQLEEEDHYAVAVLKLKPVQDEGQCPAAEQDRP